MDEPKKPSLVNQHAGLAPAPKMLEELQRRCGISLGIEQYTLAIQIINAHLRAFRPIAIKDFYEGNDVS